MKIQVTDLDNDLLPCPFCGSEDLDMRAFSIVPDCRVVCNSCGASIEKRVPWGVNLSEVEHDRLCEKVLREAWNKREGK